MTVAPTKPTVTADLKTVKKFVGMGRLGAKDNANAHDPDFEPASPTGVQVVGVAREVKNHLEYKLRVECDANTANECLADIDVFYFQFRYTNAAGSPIDGTHKYTKAVPRKKAVDDDSGEKPHFVFEGPLENPKRWYVSGRAAIRDNDHRRSRWSSWTTPILPSAIGGSLPAPPAPTFVSLSYDTKGSTHHNKWRGKVKISPVHSWDVPGGDHEDDMARYRCKVQVSEDGGVTWDKHAILLAEDSDDEKDEDANILMVFHRVRRRNRYRVWLASKDRFNRWGQYAGPYPTTSGNQVGGSPSQPTGVSVTSPVPRRIVADWAEPSDLEDVDYYRVIWQRNVAGTWTDYETHPRVRHTRDVIRIPKAQIGDNFRAKVTAFDVDATASTEAPSAGLNAASDDFGDESGAPVGSIKHYPGGAAPNGWLKCDGTGYSTATWPQLYAAIGYTYNEDYPVGSGTFEVPDLRKRKVKGVGTSDNVGEDEGILSINETSRVDDHNIHGGHTTHGGHLGHGGHNGHYQDSQAESAGHSHGTAGYLSTGGPSNTQNNISAGGTQSLATSGHSHNVQGQTGPRDVNHYHAHYYTHDSWQTVQGHGSHNDHQQHQEHGTNEHDFDSPNNRGHRQHPHMKLHFIIRRDYPT